MDNTALKALIKRAAAANWGLFLHTDADRYQMLMDKVAIIAFTSKNYRTMLAAMKLFFDRTMGKPARAAPMRAENNSENQTAVERLFNLSEQL